MSELILDGGTFEDEFRCLEDSPVVFKGLSEESAVYMAELRESHESGLEDYLCRKHRYDMRTAERCNTICL